MDTNSGAARAYTPCSEPEKRATIMHVPKADDTTSVLVEIADKRLAAVRIDNRFLDALESNLQLPRKELARLAAEAGVAAYYRNATRVVTERV